MCQSVLQSESITGKRTFYKENVTTIAFSNYSSTATSFILNGQPRTLPAIDPTTNIPTIFEVSNHGHEFTISAEFKEANTNIVIDYFMLSNNNNN